MKFYNEPAKQLPIHAEVDVLVVGSGPAGLGAAVTAARAGVSVLLLERYGCFGGVISQVGVEGFAWYRHEGTVEAGGLAFEFEKMSDMVGGSSDEPQSTSKALDAEMFKYVCDKLVEDSNIRPLLHTTAVDAIIDNGLIKGIITESKSGRMVILAKRVIDCSGDADIAALAGTPFTKRENLSWVTPLFHARGVNVEKFKNYIYNDLKPTYSDWQGEWGMTTNGKEDEMFSPFLVDPFNKAIEAGIIKPEENVSFGGSFSTISDNGDVTQLNVVFMGDVDCTNVEDLTKAEIKGRESVLNAMRALKQFAPGFENASLRNFGMTIGTRESRQIEGHYYMTGDDTMNEGRFDDSIGIFPEFVDGNGMLWIPTTGRYFQIPYRALLPKKIDNLLVAGRSISGDLMAHASFRNMACCVVTGQGAGAAAAVSIKDNVPTSKVDITKVQAELRRQNVRVD